MCDGCQALKKLQKVMAVRRKWILSLAFAACLVVLLYQSPFFAAPEGGFSNPVSGPQRVPYEPPPKVNDGRFHWSDVPVRNPVSHYIPLPTGTPLKLPKVQSTFRPEDKAQAEIRQHRLEEVKKTFQKCWNSYQTRAWMQDELASISGESRNPFGGWAATLVDAMDALWIMDLKEEFKDAATAAANIDFTTSTEDTINVFETTIRYLGGFLAAYDLSGEKSLLDLAVKVGEMLYVAFDTPNHFPITRWDVNAAKAGATQVASDWNLVSEIGSLVF
jgi:mannosyl-oligosaccharide alpha-1,2-mannosidase